MVRLRADVMEIVEDNPAARWLPSRHRFALTRLIARVILSRSEAKTKDLKLREHGIDHLLLAIDRDQSNVETFTIALWVLLASSCYVAALLPLQPWAALLLGIPIAAFTLQLPIYFGANSFLLMLIQFSAAAVFATTGGPVHYVAWLSLMIFIANAIAWLIDKFSGI